ncbi:hypothetical protein DYI42_04195 [Vannielia litorea]|nr:hypothetical protein [Vannielia litorea]
MDGFARRFLHRFAAGAFSRFAAILFCRDDVAALAAYQYALELRRQGRVAPGPRLILWNLLHGTSDALHAFNLSEAERALAELHEVLGAVPDAARTEGALVREARRQAACAALEESGLSARERYVFRNAGRWLAPEHHAALLENLVPKGIATRRRAALVGAATDTPALVGLCDDVRLGLTDLTPYGQGWPACHAGPGNLPGLLRSVSEAPLHIRTNPPARFGAALDAGISGCDLVISAVDGNDDSFGWELPRLRRSLSVPLVDLGFRPFRPDEGWLSDARAQIEEALT